MATGSSRSWRDRGCGMAHVVLLACGLVVASCGESARQAPSHLGMAAMVITFGLSESGAGMAERVAARLDDVFREQGIAAVPAIARVECSPDAIGQGQTAACYDVRLLMPFVAERREGVLREFHRSNAFVRALAEQEDLANLVTFAERRGLAFGGEAALLLAVRRLLDVPADAPAALPEPLVQPVGLGAAASTVTVDTLVWTDSTTVVAKSSEYEQRILAPGYGGAAGSSGTWALMSLGGRVGDGKFKCLFGDFVDVNTGAKTRVSAGDCSSYEKYVTLSAGQLAAGVEMKVSDNDLKGVGLARGTPSRTVDSLTPDFLTGVSSSNFVFSGSSDGTYAPDTSQLTASWPFVVVGVAAKAQDGKISGLTVHLGRLTALEPDPGDLWQQHAIVDIEAATVLALNTYYDYLVDTLEFSAAPDCPGSTIPRIEFCDYMGTSASYSTSDLDDACAGTCSAYYETCKVSKDACEVACCYGCAWGKTCSCNYDCGDEKDSCYDGCTDVATGSVTIRVEDVTGLENLEFKDASVPYLPDEDSVSLAVDMSLEVSPGLVADVYWKLCQSGICAADTTEMKASEMTATARGTLTARACPQGAPALYLTIDEVEIIDPGVWGIDDFVDDVVAVAQGTLDWLAENIDDLFHVQLADEYENAMNGIESSLENELNSLLVESPVVPCS